jgi:hypothetical protein
VTGKSIGEVELLQLVRISKRSEERSEFKMADLLVPRFRKYRKQKLISLKPECHAITNKYPEAASVLQVYSVISDIQNITRKALSGPLL